MVIGPHTAELRPNDEEGGLHTPQGMGIVSQPSIHQQVPFLPKAPKEFTVLWMSFKISGVALIVQISPENTHYSREVIILRSAPNFFKFSRALQILRSTPKLLNSPVSGICSDEWHLLRQVAIASASGYCFGKWLLLRQVAFAPASGICSGECLFASESAFLLQKVAFAPASGFCSGASNSPGAIAALSTVYHHK